MENYGKSNRKGGPKASMGVENNTRKSVRLGVPARYARCYESTVFPSPDAKAVSNLG
jgi:hypothetical protein